MKIMLKDGPIKPLQFNTPRKTPNAFQNQAKSKLDYLVELGVLEEVKDVSDWCSPMSPNGDVEASG